MVGKFKKNRSINIRVWELTRTKLQSFLTYETSFQFEMNKNKQNQDKAIAPA